LASLIQRFSPMRVWRVLKDLNSKGRDTGVPRHQVLREQYRLFRQCGLGRHEYYLYGLWRPELAWNDKISYVGEKLFLEFWRTIVPPTYWTLFQNKLVSKRLFQSVNLPAPKLLAIYEPSWGALADGSPFRTRDDLRRWLNNGPPDAFVVKPIEGEQGEGIRAFKRDPNEPMAFRAPEGNVVRNENDLHDAMTRKGKLCGRRHPDSTLFCPGYMIEEYVRQHPCLDELSPHACCAIRIAAARGRDGKVKFIGAGINLQTSPQSHSQLGDVKADVLALIDIETGILGKGVIKVNGVPPALEKHPVTGVKFKGLQLPHWQEVKDVALRAMDLLPMAHAIGWDIAITESGVSLFEGNVCFGLMTIQSAASRGILHDIVLERCCESSYPRLKKLAQAVRDGQP
jgi:Sugar-transfer associated ATP-grasp